MNLLNEDTMKSDKICWRLQVELKVKAAEGSSPDPAGKSFLFRYPSYDFRSATNRSGDCVLAF